MNRLWFILCSLLLLGCLFWFFPLFHVIRIQQVDNPQHESAFNAADFAKTFWSGRLIPSLTKAPDAVSVLSAFQSSPEAAREKFGRKVGVSRTRLLVLRGGGTIVSVDKSGVGVDIEGDAKGTDVVLQTGLLFGNTVRDATGLLDASNFPDSREFNEISTELNRIIETDVVPKLKERAVVGRKINFTACAEIPDEGPIDKPLKVIPLDIRVE